MTDYDTDPDAPTMEEVAEQLRLDCPDQRRGIVADADEVIGLENNCVECHHHCSDGEIIIQLEPHMGWRMGDDENGDWLMADERLQKYTEWEV